MLDIIISSEEHRPSWDEYFMMMAKLAATRSTCLAFPVGAGSETGLTQVRYL